MATKGRSAKVKGSDYERTIAKKLSKMFRSNVQRTGGSGAYRGIDTVYNHSRDSGDRSFVGDIYFPSEHPFSIFNFELKNHAGVKLANLFNNNGEIPSFLQQVTTDSRRLGGVGSSVPCLIIHVTREDDYVVIPYTSYAYVELSKCGSAMITMLSYDDKRLDHHYRYQVVVTNLNTFGCLDSIKTKEVYQDYDWEVLNHFKETTKETNPNDYIDKME